MTKPHEPHEIAQTHSPLECGGFPIRAARRVAFSAAHSFQPIRGRKAEPQPGDETSKGIGRLESHDYILEAFVEGPIDAGTGLLMNLIDLDRAIKTVTEALDRRHLERDVPYFQEQTPSIEAIARYCHNELKLVLARDLPEEKARLYKTRIHQGDELWAEYDTSPAGHTLCTSGSQVTFTRTYTIRALHNLCNPDITDRENERLYGMCYRLHGHDYKVMVTISAPVDPETGLCPARLEIDEIVQRHLIDRFDGQCLNDTFTNTSGEALTHLWWDCLRPHLPTEVGLGLAIQETRKNYFERPPGHTSGASV